jgi:hypothetical protein
MVLAKCEYWRTLSILQDQLPNKVRLLRLEKYYDVQSKRIEWHLIFWITNEQIPIEVIAGVEDGRLIGGEPFSDVPYNELLTKVRVFC